ncbi:MAG: response regulator [Elusimicrobia bacterium]|nr:response regulator [Elusimicrobiota bacterium]
MASPGKKGRILIVDDEPAILELIGHVLTDEGHEICFASDGQQGLEKAASFAPDIIILDVMMPLMHGIEALRRLKADPKTAAIKVVVFSTKDFSADRSRALEMGAIDVIAKPPDLSSFRKLIRELLASGAPPAAAAASANGSAQPAPEYHPKLSTGRGTVRLWGTRGSVPVSGTDYVRQGGNTSCLTLELGDDLVILDAGTGIRPLGEALAAGKPRRMHLFITHTHWDHIQGFPFFVPAYLPGFELSVYGAKGFGKNLKEIFKGQLDRDYFPAQLEDMRAKIDFHELAAGAVQAGAMKVSWEYTHHPGATVGYKVEMGSRKVAYVSDNEFLKGYLGAPGAVSPGSDLVLPHKSLIDFVSDADLLIAEAQYTNEEYKTKIGWGHSSLSNACLFAKLAQIKRWLVTHHEPRYGDKVLQDNLNLTRQVLEALDWEVEVRHAFDGMTELL